MDTVESVQRVKSIMRYGLKTLEILANINFRLQGNLEAERRSESEATFESFFLFCSSVVLRKSEDSRARFFSRFLPTDKEEAAIKSRNHRSTLDSSASGDGPQNVNDG